MGLTQALAAVGAAGAILFVLVFTVDGWTRPNYDPVRQPVSALACGARGWVQTANFLVCGSMIAVGGAGLTQVSWVLGVSIIVFGVGLILSGLFPMDAMRGYPPGTPDTTPATFSRRHQWHDHAGAVVFFTIPVMPAVAVFTTAFSAEMRGASAIVVVLAVVLVSRFATAWENDEPRAGLWQRAALALIMVWLVVVCANVAQ
ncbi:DUF998 domain-containing protein [Hoyosella rhizosphaerae]|uniref:DUF998 domain-containing protein n=1 Tax=Hoyosella rhizosphaerae TaxID=1755582 RepID=A0A916TZX3_9ACTN|nr:DUF998 domain-containing protein [Hoyosella rhizosphaerae]MBN4927133.1 DUF998 domain-containing protein [Hoyosella rhizosphaerae]GGC53723.1 hypothetical protein GCM10011410_02630 [Hoyosella rhizosphaerae]